VKKKDFKINLQLGKLKEKLAQKKADLGPEREETKEKKEKVSPAAEGEIQNEERAEAPRRKARSVSAFADQKSHEELKADIKILEEPVIEEIVETPPPPPPQPIPVEEVRIVQPKQEPKVEFKVESKAELKSEPKKETKIEPKIETRTPPFLSPKPHPAPYPKKEQLGPTGRHIKDLLPKKKPLPPKREEPPRKPVSEKTQTPAQESEDKKKWAKGPKVREFRDFKPAKKGGVRFDSKQPGGEEDQRWRKKRPIKGLKASTEDTTIRPSALKVRLPISIKDLAQEMKLKASELIQKLFLQGSIVTINDTLEDETAIQLLGMEFGCQISIDTSEAEKIRITDQTVREEILSSTPENLVLRAPVAAFMGHVDHGKTSLIDKIRKSNVAAGEAGAITQHIGAFRCKTAAGDITILDTPGHAAFSAMRARGADVTDIVVLVVAGDEGMRAQTLEALQHAKAAGVTIIVAANKCDKPNFDFDKLLRQLADNELLAEAWGGQTIVVKCSAVTGEGIPELLEMLALQAEVLELKANPKARARGTVIESEMHKGLGMVANVIVLNGTLKQGDALVFEDSFAKVKTMYDEQGKIVKEAGPSTPVEITGLSSLPEAGEEFIAVASDHEAKKIAEARFQGKKWASQQIKKSVGLDSLLQQSQGKDKKILKILLRADVQGSLEALKSALEKIESEKAIAEVIFAGVGEISESDVQLAAASNAMILGFHVQVESHADPLVKQHGVKVKIHNIIYHAIDEVKQIMTDMLDKIVIEVEKGKAEIKQVFKSSQYGNIAGCAVLEGPIHRNHLARLKRNGEVVWKGTISTIRREKDEVREIQKGFECGITLNGYNQIQPGDIIESYEISYKSQEL
jgi:translation initiation factor IF-2